MVFINEFHYDNDGTDANEFIELAGLAGTDLTGWSLVLYNGANGLLYNTQILSGLIPDQSNGYGTVVVNYPVNGIQNGAPDGIALVDNTGTVVQFLSYEGAFTALDGPAQGMMSVDIGIAETGTTPLGFSLQLTGTGSTLEDFTWLSPAQNTRGQFNTGQTFTGGSPTPGITITETNGNTEVNEEGETTDTYTIALNTTPSAPVTIAIAADPQTQISVDGVNFFESRTITLTDTTPATITVRAVNDTNQEGQHTSTITHTIDPTTTDPDYATLSIPNVTVNVIDNEVALSFTKINQIQGAGSTFDANFAGVQTIEAIVVGDFQRTGSAQNLRGFYVQEEDADADTNSLTSEGLFIFDDAFGVDVQVGDKVQITGTVAEFTSGTSSLTQLTNISTVTIVSSENPLPTAATVSFPLTNATDLESYEGMVVNIPDPLTVTEHFQLGRFGQVVLSSDGATNQTGTDGRLEQYTQFNAPSVEGYQAYLAELAKRRIVVDDGLTVQNPDPIRLGRGGEPLSATNTLRGGDTVTGIAGILDDRFGAANLGNYRIQPVNAIDFQPSNPRPTTAPNVGGSLKVASFNVLNYFNGDGTGGGFPTSRGADSAAEFARQRDKTIAAILGLDADIVGLIEIENDGYGTNSAIQDLVNGLNAVAGVGTYAFIDPGTPNLGTDEIAVGFIYKPERVTPIGSAATIANGFGQGAFDADNRKPLAQTFQDNTTGAIFTPVINHFKSKGSSAGNPGDENAGDGQGLSNGTRTRASQDLAAWLATNPTGTTDSDYMILGDLNAYAQEDPITTLEAAGYSNLLPDTTYSYVFDGQWGSLDHALANSSLASQVTGAAKWHINADEPNVLDYNTNFKSPNQIDSLYAPNAFRSSDHDPVLVGLNLTQSTNTINGTNQADTLEGTTGNDRISGLNGNDTIAAGFGNDTLIGGNGEDQLDGGRGNDSLIGGLAVDRIGGRSGNDTLTGGQGADRFVFAAGDDTDTITDFTTIDVIELTGGLTFEQLTVNQGMGANLNDTIIQVTGSNQVLAILTGVQANTISAANFVTA